MENELVNVESNEREELIELPITTVLGEPVTSKPKTIDEGLVKSAIDGDKKAFEQLFMLTYGYVYMMAKKRLSHDDDIYDAIQETFMKVYSNLDRLSSPSAFLSWLKTIADNAVTDIIRKSVPTSVEFDEEFVEINENGEVRFDSEVNLDITEVLDQLSHEQSELLIRVYYDGMTVTDIAKMQGLPKTTVYSRLNVAKKELKRLLKIRGIEKAMYGGSAVAMFATVIRNAIGTDLLSIAVAEEILHKVISGDKKRAAVIGTIARKQRNEATIRFASKVLLFCVVVSALIVMAIYHLSDGFKFGQSSNGLLPAVGENSSKRDGTEESSTDTSNTTSEPSFHTSSEESSSTESPSSNGGSSSGSEGFISSDSSSSVSSDTSSGSSSSQNKPSVKDYLTPSDVKVVASDEFPSVSGASVVNRSDNYHNVVKSGDYIYYYGFTEVTKLKTDGSEKIKISDFPFQNVHIYNDWIYGSWDNGIYRMRIDGSGFEAVFLADSNNYVLDFVIIGDYALWKFYSDNFETYVMDLTTGEAVRNYNGSYWSDEVVIENGPGLIAWTWDPPGYSLSHWKDFTSPNSRARISNYYDSAFDFVYFNDKLIIDTADGVDIYGPAAAGTPTLLYSGKGNILYYDQYNDRTAAVYNGYAYIVETGEKLNWSSEALNVRTSAGEYYDVLDDGYAYGFSVDENKLYRVSLDGSIVQKY